jgi:hypothetical protein
MRTGCYSNKKEIVAVCLEDVNDLRYSATSIHHISCREVLARSRRSKILMDSRKKDNVLVRSVTGVRRRGIAVYMARIPVPIQQKL